MDEIRIKIRRAQRHRERIRVLARLLRMAEVDVMHMLMRAALSAGGK